MLSFKFKNAVASFMKFEEIIEGINKKSAPTGLPIRIIAIDGRGGSGKSMLAEKLAKEIGAETIHTDDFASWAKPLDWWARVVKEVFEPVKQGALTLSYRRGSWGPDHHPAAVKNQPVTPMIILEGVSSARKEFREYLTYAIWVETPLDVCLQRGLERDGQDALPNWQKWIAAENEYIVRDKPQTYADIIVDGAG